MGDNPCVSLLGKELLENLNMAGVSLKAKSIYNSKKIGKIGGLRVKRVFISGRVRGQEVRGVGGH